MWRRLWLPALGLALAVGWVRVFLGVHYPNDILGAALVGGIAALALATAAARLLTDRTTTATEALTDRLLAAIR